MTKVGPFFLTFQRGERTNIFGESFPDLLKSSPSGGLSEHYDRIFATQSEFQILMQINVPEKYILRGSPLDLDIHNDGYKNIYPHLHDGAGRKRAMESLRFPAGEGAPDGEEIPNTGNVAGWRSGRSLESGEPIVSVSRPAVNPHPVNVSAYINDLVTDVMNGFAVPAPDRFYAVRPNISTVENLGNFDFVTDFITQNDLNSRAAHYPEMRDSFLPINASTQESALESLTQEYKIFLQNVIIESPHDRYVYFDICQWAYRWSSEMVECRPRRCLPVASDVGMRPLMVLKHGELWSEWSPTESGWILVSHPEVSRYVIEPLDRRFPVTPYNTEKMYAENMFDLSGPREPESTHTAPDIGGFIVNLYGAAPKVTIGGENEHGGDVEINTIVSSVTEEKGQIRANPGGAFFGVPVQDAAFVCLRASLEPLVDYRHPGKKNAEDNALDFVVWNKEIEFAVTTSTTTTAGPFAGEFTEDSALLAGVSEEETVTSVASSATAGAAPPTTSYQALSHFVGPFKMFQVFNRYGPPRITVGSHLVRCQIFYHKDSFVRCLVPGDESGSVRAPYDTSLALDGPSTFAAPFSSKHTWLAGNVDARKIVVQEVPSPKSLPRVFQQSIRFQVPVTNVDGQTSLDAALTPELALFERIWDLVDSVIAVEGLPENAVSDWMLQVRLVSCPPGSYRSSPSSLLCLPCPPGTYSNLAFSGEWTNPFHPIQCMTCFVGEYPDLAGEDIDYIQHYYQDEPGASQCTR